MKSMVGFKIPEVFHCDHQLLKFRRAKSKSSLEIMYNRVIRDLRGLAESSEVIKVYELEAYRAYLRREDELLTQTGLPEDDPLAKALSEHELRHKKPVPKPRSAAKSAPKPSPKPSAKKAAASEQKPEVRSSKTSRFTEAERQLAEALRNC